jgi:hypothetical protein
MLPRNRTLANMQLLQCLQQVFLVDACCFRSARNYGVLRKPNVQLPMHSSDYATYAKPADHIHFNFRCLHSARAQSVDALSTVEGSPTCAAGLAMGVMG